MEGSAEREPALVKELQEVKEQVCGPAAGQRAQSCQCAGMCLLLSLTFRKPFKLRHWGHFPLTF